ARVGFCLDTAHLHAAGYDVSTALEEVWERFEREVGLTHLKCLHLNDSKGGLGSRLDRHQWIGEGTIGPEPFRRIMRDRRVGAAQRAGARRGATRGGVRRAARRPALPAVPIRRLAGVVAAGAHAGPGGRNRPATSPRGRRVAGAPPRTPHRPTPSSPRFSFLA